MASSSDELTQRLLQALAGLPDERARRLIDAAWSEAEAAVRGTLTTAMRAVLLREVVAQLEAGRAARPAAAAPEDLPAADSGERPDDAAGQSSGEPAAATGAPDAGPEGCYVYGILDAPIDLPADLPGVDPTRRVELVTAHGLAALTSRVLTDESGPDGLRARLDDRQWLEDKVRRHEHVLQHGLRARAMVPMRFCTIVRSTEDVEEFLDAHAERLRATLDRLRGRREHGVKVVVDSERLDAHVQATSEEVRRIDAEASERGSGAAYFLDKRRKQLIAEEGERIVAVRVAAWHERLAGAADDAAALPLRREETAQQRRMVHNGAYLVADAAWDRFAAVVDALRDEGAAIGLVVDITGPWPAYTFVDSDLVADVSR